MNQKILQKKGNFQNFSWFQFYVYKLCMIMCIGIAPSVKTKSRQWDFMEKLLPFHSEMISV